jgi:N-acetylmuramoyl-L-alanine amidase
MSYRLNKASAIAVAATLITVFASAEGSGAAAESKAPVVIQSDSNLPMISQPIIQPVPEVVDAAQATPVPAAPSDGKQPLDAELPMHSARSLAALVSAQPQPGDLSRELNCLAGAVYFESKSETLPGQLAVGRVVVARSKSGRFPNSYCGVVFQRSQFSFVRGNAMPGIVKSSRQWKNAVAIAQIAHSGSWQSQVEGALYFHAARVSPGWRLTRVGRVDNHVFYR